MIMAVMRNAITHKKTINSPLANSILTLPFLQRMKKALKWNDKPFKGRSHPFYFLQKVEQSALSSILNAINCSSNA